MGEIRQGRKPLSEKKKPASFGLEDIFGNTLGVDPEVKEMLEKKGLDCRYINAKKLADFGGYHEHGWSPIKLKDIYGTMDPQALKFGQDPDGYIRRAELVLATRPKELGKKHRQWLHEQAREASLSHKSKAHADEMRAYAKQAGLDMQVHEGYEDEGEQEK